MKEKFFYKFGARVTGGARGMQQYQAQLQFQLFCFNELQA